MKMTRQEYIDYWVTAAKHDFKTMNHLFEKGDYIWALFIGHLVLEKLLKAFYVKQVDAKVPHIHDLLRIADKASLNLTVEKKSFLDCLNDFNIEARYPDYKLALYKKCNKEFSIPFQKKIVEFKKWILKKIEE